MAITEKNKLIEADYIITLDKNKNEIYKQGKTLLDGYIIEKIPINNTFNIFVNADGFYTVMMHENSGSYPLLIRLHPELSLIGNLTVYQDKKLSESEYINITLQAKEDVRFINYCIEWTSSIIRIESSNKERLKGKVDKCYKTYYSLLNNDNYAISLYIKHLNLLSSDYIKIYINDGDIRYYSIKDSNNGMDSYVIEENKKDIAMQEIIYTLN